MGTDIHMNFERLVGTPPADRMAAVVREVFSIPSGTAGWERVDCEVWEDRSYVTFAVLANVRNGYGFAGCKTHTPVEPIAMPRGVPRDVGSWYDEDACGFDHTPTWLLLSEVLAYDWSREVVRTGVVPLSKIDNMWHTDYDSLEQMLVDERSTPKSWSGGVTGPGIVTVDYPTGRRLLAEPDQRKVGTQYYFSVEWKAALSDTCAPFLAWARSLTSIDQPDRIRLVFGFDS